MVNLLKSINLVLLLLVLLMFLGQLWNALRKKINLFGRPPVHRAVFIVGKLANFNCWGIFYYQVIAGWFKPRVISVPLLAASTLALFFSALLVFLSFRRLGDLNKFGLPEEKTRIVQTGVYSFSRNPMYLGFYLLNLASVLYFPHPLNLALGVVGVAIHHLIVLGEESFMAATFGAEWDEYRKKVGRYF
ncbi:MAG: isoprenylcysteine carboxylmethyltransferase family protein [Acidobacteria bacterium]|nr:isoprenylcysteine carboxylmethyltransferase family protein [Acidobacteriota bacterium]MBU4404916.1 isoprenylcysteine carboxylmethyltransferase family protein [Acidobacteriota bacterium]MCG2812037.1 isoprenylcysteine carboxylmethyltransferase family protein [Candidatus Aminicenantes bacterium]